MYHGVTKTQPQPVYQEYLMEIPCWGEAYIERSIFGGPQKNEQKNRPSIPFFGNNRQNN